MNSDNNPLFNVHEIVQVSPEELASVFNEYFNKRVGLINEAVESQVKKIAQVLVRRL